MRKPAHQTRTIGPAAALLAALTLGAAFGAACDSKADGTGGTGTYGGGGTTTGAASCRDSCPKGCAVDTDCALSDGQICCSFNTFGSACVKAKDCPRFCDADTQCDTGDGEICCRTAPWASEKICSKADECLLPCTGNGDCGNEAVCCTSAAEPVCTKPEKCPKTCGQAQDCAVHDGEVCCFTQRDAQIAQWGYTALAVGGVCTDVEKDPCPVACTASQQCPEKAPICCPTGFCAETCEQPCTTNNDCNLGKGEFCCDSQVHRSPWF